MGPGSAELPASFSLDNLTLLSGARAVAAQGGALRGKITGTLTIESGASLDVTGQGFAGGIPREPGGAPAGITPSTADAGGSHGGRGIRADAGDGGEVYDSVYVPQQAGGGGAGDEDCCGDGHPGGGVIELRSGEVVLNGEILARGVSGGSNRPAGAGGSILLEATRITGSGTIDASGGHSVANGEPTGPGGGGRVALYADELVGFDPALQVAVYGGRRQNGATVFNFRLSRNDLCAPRDSLYGDLLIDNGEDANGNDRPSAATILPTLGAGSVPALTLSAPTPSSPPISLCDNVGSVPSCAFSTAPAATLASSCG